MQINQCDIMIDQLRAIDNKRLIKKVGSLPVDLAEMVCDNIKLIPESEWRSKLKLSCCNYVLNGIFNSQILNDRQSAVMP